MRKPVRRQAIARPGNNKSDKSSKSNKVTVKKLGLRPARPPSRPIVAAPAAGRSPTPFRVAVPDSPSAETQLRNAQKGLYEADRPIVVLVFANWCHFCNDLKPSWDAFARSMESTGLGVLEVDTDALNAPAAGSNSMVDKIRQEYTGSIPHIAMVSRNTPETIRYDGADRSPQGLMQFVYNAMSDRRIR